MKGKISITFFLFILFLITSCNDSKSNVRTKKDAKSNVKSIKDTMVIDSTTENRFVYVKEIISSNESLYLKVDYVDYLTGKEAVEAEWRDQAYFIDGADTISNITDGYYISNINPKIRTFKIGIDALIENIIDDNGSHKIKPSKDLNVEQLREYVDLETLLFIYIEDGIVKRIDERFVP